MVFGSCLKISILPFLSVTNPVINNLFTQTLHSYPISLKEKDKISGEFGQL